MGNLSKVISITDSDFEMDCEQTFKIKHVTSTLQAASLNVVTQVTI